MTLHVYSQTRRGTFLFLLFLSLLADGSSVLFYAVFGCVCVRECVFILFFRDLLERINNMRVKQKPEMAVCFIVMFLPYVFVPAGRSCFWLPNLIGLLVHPVNQKMQVGDHQCVTIGQLRDLFFMLRIYLHVYGHKGAVEFHRSVAVHASHWPSRHNSTQISHYKCALLNVLFSSLGF